MVFTKTIEVMEPEQGRMCEVFLTEDQLNKLLTIGVGVLLNAGIVSIIEHAQLDGSMLHTLTETKGNA